MVHGGCPCRIRGCREESGGLRREREGGVKACGKIIFG